MITDLIVFISPAIAALLAWFIVNHIAEVKDRISEVKGKVGQLDEKVSNLDINVVIIKKDIEHMKELYKVKSNLTVIKEIKKQ